MSGTTDRSKTAYELAVDRWSLSDPDDHRETAVALYRMCEALHEELARERAIVRDQAATIRGLRQTLAQLQPCPELPAEPGARQAVAAEPTWRLRLHHAHTVKDGWRLAETTVEVVSPQGVTDDELQVALFRARHVGVAEAERRNAAETGGAS